ncbi:uncharacterized protein LOC131940862 [Physella acuta]|uniref:uncharacterized protein LOC131940862 n=1 Tax=Physella acuta TaxID=109671 RepID=UPI0027DD0B3A|nr:uncharacterized protein LOC131940862 [Physella acuta]
MDSFIELQVVELKQQLEEVMCERDALRKELSAFRAKPCGMQGGLPFNQLSASTEIENKKEFKVDEKHEGPFNCGVVELLTEMNTELEKELDKIKYSVMKINELSPIGKWQCPEIKQHNLTPVQNESKRKYLNFLDDEVIQEKPNLKNIDEEMSRSMFNLHLEFISLKRIVEESLFKNNDLQLQFFKSLQKQNNIAEVKNSGPNPEFDFISLQSTLLEKKQENSDMIYLFSLLEELKIGSRLSNILRQLEISMKDKVQLEEKHFSDLTPVGVVDAAKLFSMLKEIDNICTQLESKALLLSEMREKENVTLSEMATQTEEDLSLYEINITKLVGTDQYNLAHLTLSDPQSEADVLNDNVFTRLPGDGVGMDNVSHKSKQVSLATRQPLAKYSDAGKNNRSSKRKIKQVSFTFPSIEQFSYIHPKKVYSFLTYVHLSDTRHVKKFRRLKHKIVHNQESNTKSQPRGLLQENHLNSVTEDKAVEITSELNLTEWNIINVDERDVEYNHRNNTTTATSHQENLTHTDLTKPGELAPMLSQPTSKRSGIRRFFSTKKKKDASPKLEHAAPHYDYDDLFFPWPSLLFYFLGGW